MKITDNEKRDIIRSIEEGKDLPEKFKYLLFKDAQKVEINWEDKKSELTNVCLPFQTIEHIDEPREEKELKAQKSLDFAKGQKLQGWTNKLIWGDNKFIVSSILKGPMRNIIEQNGGVKLVYIDPPFSVGMNYTIPVSIGSDGSKYDKKPTIIENFAYRNMWGKEGNSFLQMLFERISLMRNLLRDDGVLVMRIDHHWGHYAKAMLDEIFGKEHFRNEIFINRTKKNTQKNTRQMMLTTSIESLFVYSKTDEFEYLDTSYKLKEAREGYWRAADDSAGESQSPERIIEGKVFHPPKGKHFKFSQENIDKMHAEGTIRINEKTGKIQYYVQPSAEGQLDTNWTDIPGYSFSTKYPTENHEKLIERVIKACSKEEDIVCDFFNGSGTTATVAEKLNRKWIASDIGKFSIHTTRKRLINTQRDLKEKELNWRAFEILNIGKYQKQHYLDDGIYERDEDKFQARKRGEELFEETVLEAYGGQTVENFKTIHGRKNDSFISIGPINFSVNREYVNEVITECLDNKIRSIDILGFGYEMGLFPKISDEASEKGLSLRYKQIPNDIFNEDAVKNNAINFFDISYIGVDPKFKKDNLTIELTDFKTFHNFDVHQANSNNKKSLSLHVENGQIFETRKDKEGNLNKTLITKSYVDWIDYWAVDFDYQKRKEIIYVEKDDGSFDEQWTGQYIFENQWQSYRTKDQELELVTPPIEVITKERIIAIRVVDIFGIDTLKVIKVTK